ncbi:MAG: ketopantoate reductase family protein [Longimicrobiales bacterium]|nr:ketopantoate reductase family protein [Longimicrobiales bacterium]
MRVVVVGAGGLGSYVGAVLAQAGHDVALVTRGDHRTIIESDGLRVQSHAGDFVVHPTCVASAQELDGADLAFVATKTFSLEEVAPQLVHLAEAGGDVVSLLNGVTALDRLEAMGVPRERMADGVAYMTSFRVEPGVVERKAAHQKIVVGDVPASRRIREAFRDTLVTVEVADDVQVELWEKMAVVCSLSVLCALGERNMGSVRGHPLGAELQRAAIGEVLAVGRAHGVAVPADAEARIDERLDRFPDDFFPSVIHDLNNRRPTEMEDLGGAVARLGRRGGVATPLHDAGTMVVQLAEKRTRSG